MAGERPISRPDRLPDAKCSVPDAASVLECSMPSTYE